MNEIPVFDLEKAMKKNNIDKIQEKIDSDGLSGFFGHSKNMEPIGIQLQYNIEEVKKTIANFNEVD